LAKGRGKPSQDIHAEQIPWWLRLSGGEIIIKIKVFLRAKSHPKNFPGLG
jgi:hypothetical protein